MRLTLLGADDDTLELVRWAVDAGGHELLAAFDVGPHAPQVRSIAPGAFIREDWESLLAGSLADAVVVGRGGAGLAEHTGIADDERRADQLRKLVQERIPLLVTCPACEAIVGFAIEMIRRDVGGIIVPYVPGFAESEIEHLPTIFLSQDSGFIGRVEQLVLQRQQADRSREAVLVSLARDISTIRQLLGPIRSVTATGSAMNVGRDPLGPRVAESPALGNLSVHFGGSGPLPARWSIGPVIDEPGLQLMFVGESDTATYYLSPATGVSIRVGKHRDRLGAHFQTTLSPEEELDSRAEAISRLQQAIGGNKYDNSAWLNACRDQEAAEAVDRSLARGRTIELYQEPHTEDASFKGVMSMGGCVLLLGVLALVLAAAFVEGLQLPVRNWPVWRLWPVYLLVAIGVFLLLQLFKLAVKHEEPALPQPSGSEQPPE